MIEFLDRHRRTELKQAFWSAAAVALTTLILFWWPQSPAGALADIAQYGAIVYFTMCVSARFTLGKVRAECLRRRIH